MATNNAWNSQLPAQVSVGGTGNTTFTAYSVLCAGTTATGAFQNVVGVGTSGQVLTSAGAGALPSWQSPAASSISITGNTGGALTGAAFTFTGGTTGLAFNGAGTTETLGGTLVVSNGGTGATTFTAHSLLLGQGTSAITALGAATNGQIAIGSTGADPVLALPSNGNNISWTGGAGTLTANLTGTTNHAVQVGSAAGALSSLAVGTTGTVLTGVTGGDPVWAAPAASSISITGNSGGALTGAAFTFTGGTTGLTFSGAGTTETLTGDLVVANGGTGNTTFTAYSVITAGTTATGAFQNVSGVGTAGQVLTSAGAGALPVWAAASAGGTTWSVITANQTAAVNNGYFCNKAGTLTLALPASSAVGDVIEVSNINTATGCQFTQAASQQIFIGNTSTTAGATGTLTSSAIGDSLKLVCRTANLTWFVVSGWGNWTPA